MRISNYLLATVLVASALAGSASCQTYSTRKALPADSFVDSIGVNIHLTYTNTTYGAFETLVKPELLKSGIRHVRDGVVTWVGTNSSTYYYERLRELSGVKITLISNPSDTIAMYPSLQSWCGGNLEAIEGINEPDIQGNPLWPVETLSWQQELYSTVKSTPSLAGVKVLSPSIAWYDTPLIACLTNYCDSTNAHDYTSGDVPLATWPWVSACAKTLANKPLEITESGYHNAYLGKSNSQVGVSELASSKYMLRSYFDYFNAGVSHTFAYELLDEAGADELTDQEDAFGLIRANGTEKPVFKGITNLIAILKDPGVASTPTGFAYHLSGGNANTASTLLQKRDGSYWLAYWQEISVWNRVALKDVVNASVPLTLSFPSEQNVSFYNPLESSSSTSTSKSVSSVSLSSSDSVQLIKIVPTVTP